MSTIQTSPGFFSTSGKLLSESASGPESAGSGTNSEVTDEVTAITAREITEAVVVNITSRLNVGATGFDAGTRDTVLKAVTAALQNLSGTEFDDDSLREVGGTFQNSILAREQDETDPEPSTPVPGKPVSSTPDRRPSKGRGVGRGGRRLRIA
jgi:Arc/MetJ family transcription regulator